MRPRLPRVSGKDMIDFLKIKGFYEMRIRGSHYVLSNNEGKITVIPVHKGETLGPGLIKEILVQSEISVDEYTKYFQKK